MTEVEQEAQEMRWEVQGLCYQCGERLRRYIRTMQLSPTHPCKRAACGLCDDCWAAFDVMKTLVRW